MYVKVVKPILDFSFSLVAFILLMPLLLFIAIAIRIDSKGAFLFRQKRVGFQGEEFIIYKFRTMEHLVKENEHLAKRDRVTNMGRLLRQSRLDELPQLFNILKGEMSVIGPRPPECHYPKPFSEYTILEKQRFSVKPGLSGLAQIRKLNEPDWSKVIPLDIEYVKNISFKLDLKIFFASFIVFLSKEDEIA